MITVPLSRIRIRSQGCTYSLQLPNRQVPFDYALAEWDQIRTCTHRILTLFSFNARVKGDPARMAQLPPPVQPLSMRPELLALSHKAVIDQTAVESPSIRLFMTSDVRAATGLSRTHLDFYIREGLVQPVARTESGYLLFDQSEVDLLRGIVADRRLNVPLKDIRQRLGR
ncbi:hypothetical protein BH24CHL4_BH24CHL4_17020 [soil metagenome]